MKANMRRIVLESIVFSISFFFGPLSTEGLGFLATPLELLKKGVDTTLG
jgi:hypothetical protein